MTHGNDTDIETVVRKYLIREFPDRKAEIEQLTAETSLIDINFLSSLSFFGLVIVLERQFAISIPPEDCRPSKLDSLQAIINYVSARNHETT